MSDHEDENTTSEVPTKEETTGETKVESITLRVKDQVNEFILTILTRYLVS